MISLIEITKQLCKTSKWVSVFVLLCVCIWEDDKYYIISLQSSKGAEKHNIHLLKKKIR